MPTTSKKPLDHVWTALSLPSLHPCSTESDSPRKNELPYSDESTVLSLGTAGSSHKNGGICFEYMSEFSSFCKKRGSEYDGDLDPRHKRMIKNRESAVRSRARRQAYTNELEIEVKHLMEENAGIRLQLEKFRASAATEVPKKLKLLRTSSASF